MALGGVLQGSLSTVASLCCCWHLFGLSRALVLAMLPDLARGRNWSSKAFEGLKSQKGTPRSSSCFRSLFQRTFL